jgi:hypothetical protein
MVLRGFRGPLPGVKKALLEKREGNGKGENEKGEAAGR